MKNMDDFNEMLRKAMEEEQRDDSHEEEDDAPFPEGFGPIMNILGTGSMIKLGNAAKDRLDETIENLVKDLSKADRSNPAKFHAYAIVKIKNANDQIRILNTIISSAAFGGVEAICKNTSTKETLDRIIRMNMM